MLGGVKTSARSKLIGGLALALKEGLRDQDLLVRYGGDEFVCVLPDTPAEAGLAKARRGEIVQMPPAEPGRRRRRRITA